MKLNQVRHLVAVAQRGNLQASAAECGVSAAALVRSIRNLERELGTALVRRCKTSVVLTPVGEIFVRRAAAAQVELDWARLELRRNLGASTGPVSIGMSAGPHIAMLPKVLMPFRMRFEDVRLRIVEGTFPKVERGVRDGTLDFYVGPIRPHDRTDGLAIDKLYDVTQIVVGRSGHPLAGATSLAGLADARWIATSRLELDALFERNHCPAPVIAVEVETGLGMLSAVAASDALVILSTSWLPIIEQAGLLTILPLNGLLESSSIHIVTRTQLPLTPAAAFLHELMVGKTNDMP